MRYEVGPEGLRERSERVARASAAAARLQLGDDVARLQRAMPGARSAEAAAQLAREWDDMLCTWTQGATDHARALRRVPLPHLPQRQPAHQAPRLSGLVQLRGRFSRSARA